MDGITPTMDISRNYDGFGGGSMWLFAILALFLFGGNGGWGNRYGYGNPATVEDLNTTSNFQRLESQVRANADLTERKTDAINNGICSLGYEMANKFAHTDALIIAENQKTRDLLYQNKIETLQGQVNQLQLQQATCGVVRYPMSTAYAVPSMCFNCGCNGQNI